MITACEDADNEIKKLKEFNLNEIRKEFGKLVYNLNWYGIRGGLLPYDWNTYGKPYIVKLSELLKIDFDGSIKSKDKRGSWRVMNRKGEEND